MTKRDLYNAFRAELVMIEKATGLYLADENVDAENVKEEGLEGDAYWTAMLSAAENAAGQRAENAGMDINVLVGRIIY